MPTLAGMGEGEELHDCTKTGPVLGGLTPTASFISPGVGFKNHTCLWSAHQNSNERCKVVCCFLLFCLLSLQSYRRVTKACDLLFPERRASDQLSGTRGPGKCCQVLSDSISIRVFGFLLSALEVWGAQTPGLQSFKMSVHPQCLI